MFHIFFGCFVLEMYACFVLFCFVGDIVFTTEIHTHTRTHTYTHIVQ